MATFSKDPAAVVTAWIREQNTLTKQLPKPSATEQKAIDGSIGRGLNGTNRRQN